jgi:uncharacterized protein YycO
MGDAGMGVRQFRREAGARARDFMAKSSKQELVYLPGKNEGVRAAITPGDVLLFRGRGLLSWLIKKFTHSDYSHAGLLFRYRERVYCLEAVRWGVRLSPVSMLLEHYPDGIYYFDLDAAPSVRETALEFGFTRLCLPYDILGLVWFAVALLFARKRPEEKNERWFCSELVAAAYRSAGFPLTDGLPCYTSPVDLINGNKLKPCGPLTLADVEDLPKIP